MVVILFENFDFYFCLNNLGFKKRLFDMFLTYFTDFGYAVFLNRATYITFSIPVGPSVRPFIRPSALRFIAEKMRLLVIVFETLIFCYLDRCYLKSSGMRLGPFGISLRGIKVFELSQKADPRACS